MAVLDEIESWFAQRSRWEWQAFMAIASCETLDAAATNELTKLCIEDAAAQTKAPRQESSRAAEIPAGVAVNILSIQNVQGINRLTPGQTLSFQPTGVTVVYGDNGAGKTGYTRILRQVCRARGLTATVLSDVYTDTIGKGSADIVFSENGEEKRITCEANARLVCPLQHVSIFDANCATALVDEENDAAFRPFGLDILDHFTAVSDSIAYQLQTKITALSRPCIDVEQFANSTRVGAQLRQLATRPAARLELSQLETLNAEETEQFQELDATLKDLKTNGPDKLASRSAAQAGRFDSLRTRVSKIAGVLDAPKLEALRKLHSDRLTAASAATVFRDQTFSDELLAGVGAAEWQVMWTAARKYSISKPYQDEVFPVVGPGARCVLCAQELDDKAATRLTALEQFVKGELQQRVEGLQTALDLQIKALEALVFEAPLDGDLFVEIAQENGACATEVKNFLNLAKIFVQEALTSLRANESIPPFSAIVTPPDQLLPMITAATERAAGFRRLNQASELTEKQNAFNELDARKRLLEQRSKFDEELVRLDKLALLNKAKSSTNTTAVTRFSSGLTQKYVTQALCNRFNEEIRGFGLGNLQVNLTETRGKKGVTYHQVKLDAKIQTAAADVISEGEYRCLGLAAFLAEIAESRSAIFLDDPVCSLDHNWREKIALRLLNEGESRQVVIFTHDLAFVSVIDDLAEHQKLTVEHRGIEKRGTQAGLINQLGPWKAATTEKRRTFLRAKLPELHKLHQQAGPQYEIEMRNFYGLLRESWERVIEEYLFNSTICRFKKSVETRRLKAALLAIQATDYDVIDQAMGRCSTYLPGHDDAAALNPALPLPTDCQSDFQVFDEWAAARKKAIK